MTEPNAMEVGFYCPVNCDGHSRVELMKDEEENLRGNKVDVEINGMSGDIVISEMEWVSYTLEFNIPSSTQGHLMMRISGGCVIMQ